MTPVRIFAVIGCLAALCARLGADERNAWPFWVGQRDVAGHVTSWESMGPLFFSKPAADSATTGGFRPIFVRTKDVNGMTTVATVVYPIFIYRADSDTYRWTVFNLINRSGPRHGVAVYRADQTVNFDIWPVYFSRDTGSPETSYRALFPIVGTIKDRFGYDRLSWVIWPLYFRTEKAGAVTTSVPWPILRVTKGTETGFAFWPLFGWRDKPERFHRSFFLWPLGWNNTIQPKEDAPEGSTPLRQFGFIPFYTRDQTNGYVNECYAWPFFGYTDRTTPVRYHETRYFWPFFVQGRGDNRYINRWAPFYTHSDIKGYDKHWYMWPLVRRANWVDDNIAQTRTQFLYVLYWSQEQRKISNPNAAPANRTHVWPLFSKWDNGAGQRQFQLLSPLDVFFPDNQHIRDSWTPLFAIYRYDQRTPTNKRWSFLWSAVSWRHEGAEKEFHLGPLLTLKSKSEQSRVSIAKGLIGLKRDPDNQHWRPFVFDFPSKPRIVTAASR
ncbi:MAG: hypothetical protein JWM32_2280 [Verrucomicrobia bacterium]|nr:hypothetical protein [Verrucomicrobiota bacterium]